MRIQYFLALGTILLFASSIANAQDKPQKKPGGKDLMGEIKIEGEDKKRDFYGEGQEAAITYFKTLKQTLQDPATSKSPTSADIPDLALNHLSGVFLYCTTLYGSCTFLLDSLLEVDIIKSKSSGTVSCPNLKKFWTAWVKNGLEERQKYAIPTGFITAVNQFDATQRPRYLRCEKTVQEEVGTAPAGTFFQQRYSSGSEKVKAVSKLSEVLEQVKAKIPNVFVQLGSSRIPVSESWKPGEASNAK